MTNPAATPQPPPRPGRTEVVPLVIADLLARREMGIEKHGGPLTVENGRDHLMDGLQEILDLACYIRAEVERRKTPYPLDAKVRYKPYYPTEECDGNGYDREPWRVIGITTTVMLRLAQPVVQYQLQRWDGIDAYSWMLCRPVCAVDPGQLRPWEEKPDE